MSYLNKIKERFPDFYVTEELGFQYDATNGDAIVIKYLSGQSVNGSKVLPIQLMVYTTVAEETRGKLNLFVDLFNEQSFMSELEYVREFYYTPVNLNNFAPISNNFVSQFLITGTLISTSAEISDISKIQIDGAEIEFLSANLVYVGNVDNQRISGENINKTDIINGMVRLQFNAFAKSTFFNTKIRNIRSGLSNFNTPFNIKITYTDNDFVENYVMKLDNASLSSTRDNLPIYTYQFTV